MAQQHLYHSPSFCKQSMLARAISVFFSPSSCATLLQFFTFYNNHIDSTSNYDNKFVCFSPCTITHSPAHAYFVWFFNIRNWPINFMSCMFTWNPSRGSRGNKKIDNTISVLSLTTLKTFWKQFCDMLSFFKIFSYDIQVCMIVEERLVLFYQSGHLKCLACLCCFFVLKLFELSNTKTLQIFQSKSLEWW